MACTAALNEIYVHYYLLSVMKKLYIQQKYKSTNQPSSVVTKGLKCKFSDETF